MTDKVSILFFDAHGRFAARYWQHVPRVGDEIMLDAGARYVPDAVGKAAFLVKRVVWGVEAPRGDYGYGQHVNIEITPLSKEVEA